VDCTAAEPFVSNIYDGEEAPLEAVQHVMSCASCRARLQDYARITSEMRMLAAEDQSLHVVNIPRLQPRSGWHQAWSKSVRIPRVAAVVFLLALAVATAGWVHSAAQEKETISFWCDIAIPRVSSGGSLIDVGAPPDITSAFNGDRGFASRVEALSIHDHAVVLRVQFKYFARRVDSDRVAKELAGVVPREITYVPGQQLSIAVEGGEPVLLSGHVVRNNNQIKPMGALALIPEPDEIVLDAPVLIRDDKEVLGVGSGGVHCKSKNPPCGAVFMYVPKHGLFYFSLQPMENSIEGMSGMSQLQFEEEGHRYLLATPVPLTGGDYPRKIWVLHLKDYLPSQDGYHSKSEDNQTAVGMGGAPARESHAPNH
jgi:hypothetical protein